MCINNATCWIHQTWFTNLVHPSSSKHVLSSFHDSSTVKIRHSFDETCLFFAVNIQGLINHLVYWSGTCASCPHLHYCALARMPLLWLLPSIRFGAPPAPPYGWQAGRPGNQDCVITLWNDSLAQESTWHAISSPLRSTGKASSEQGKHRLRA